MSTSNLRSPVSKSRTYMSSTAIIVVYGPGTKGGAASSRLEPAEHARAGRQQADASPAGRIQLTQFTRSE